MPSVLLDFKNVPHFASVVELSALAWAAHNFRELLKAGLAYHNDAALEKFVHFVIKCNIRVRLPTTLNFATCQLLHLTLFALFFDHFFVISTSSCGCCPVVFVESRLGLHLLEGVGCGFRGCSQLRC